MTEDWDNLLLLDACRYDAFREVNTIRGSLEYRMSKGSTSEEFIRRNFCGRSLHDTVYITANPYVGCVNPDVFHAVITLLDDWDAELQTVPPDTVVKQVLDVYQKYDDKRIIVHFMQPHQPYIGNKAAEIREKLESNGPGFVGNPTDIRGDNAKRFDQTEDARSGGVKMIDAPRRSNVDISDQDIWEAYCETLEIALNQAKRLCSKINGKTVISSDHGELIGDTPLLFQKHAYGHPGGFYVAQLRKVPWFVVECETRRQIKSAEPERYDTVDNIEEKLEALGYK